MRDSDLHDVKLELRRINERLDHLEPLYREDKAVRALIALKEHVASMLLPAESHSQIADLTNVMNLIAGAMGITNPAAQPGAQKTSDSGGKS